MTIEVALLLSMVSVSVAVIVAVVNLKRNFKSDVEQDTNNLIGIGTKLDYVATTVGSVQTDLKGATNEINSLKIKLAGIEAKMDEIGKRVDCFDGKHQARVQ